MWVTSVTLPHRLMNFDLTDEQKNIQRLARDFAQGEVKPVAEELDRTKSFPYEIVAKLAELGLMGMPFPEEYGGAGADNLSYALALEELGRIDSSVAITVAAHTSLGTWPIYAFGADDQKRELLPALCAGERLWSFGLTEPEAGSDAGNTRTTAKLEDGDWVIDGAKQFITNAGTDISGGVTITARTGDGEIFEHHRPEGHARLRGRRAVSQDGLERIGHAAARVRWGARARGEPARPARHGFQAVPPDARRRPYRRGRDERRPCAGSAR